MATTPKLCTIHGKPYPRSILDRCSGCEAATATPSEQAADAALDAFLDHTDKITRQLDRGLITVDEAQGAIVEAALRLRQHFVGTPA